MKNVDPLQHLVLMVDPFINGISMENPNIKFFPQSKKCGWLTTLTKHKGMLIQKALVIGFTGQLKSWWDNTFTPEERAAILTHKKRVRNATTGLEEEEDDCVQTLLHTITLHFSGNPKEEQAVSKTILINLRRTKIHKTLTICEFVFPTLQGTFGPWQK